MKSLHGFFYFMATQQTIEELILKYQPNGVGSRDFILLCHSVFGEYSKNKFIGLINSVLEPYKTQKIQFELSLELLKGLLNRWSQKASNALKSGRYQKYLEYIVYVNQFTALIHFLENTDYG